MSPVTIDTPGLLALLSKYFDSLYLNEVLEMGYPLEKLLQETDLPIGANFEVFKVSDGYHSTEIEAAVEILFYQNIIPVNKSNRDHINLKPLREERESFLDFYKEVLSQDGIKEPSEFIAKLEEILEEIVDKFIKIK